MTTQAGSELSARLGLSPKLKMLFYLLEFLLDLIGVASFVLQKAGDLACQIAKRYFIITAILQ